MHAAADTDAIVEYLLFERRQLRASQAGDAALEANRLALAYWQRRASAQGRGRVRSHAGEELLARELRAGR